MKKKISPKNRAIYENINNEIELLKKNDLINSYLGNKGYSIYKVCLTKNIIDFIKSELTVKPFVPPDYSIDEPKQFAVYLESNNKLYLPRFYGIQRYGLPLNNQLTPGDIINIRIRRPIVGRAC